MSEGPAILSGTIYVSLLAAVLLLFWPRAWGVGAKWFALGVSVAGLGLVALGVSGLDMTRYVTVQRCEWIPSLGIEYWLAVDGISAVLLGLTGVAAVAGVLFSWNVTDRAPAYFALYLTLIAGVYGVFLSRDLVLLFVFYELAIVPKYFLIAMWGSTRREYGAMKLALYSFAGSALVLIGLVAVYVVSGTRTMDVEALAHFGFESGFQRWAFPVVFVGFGVLAGLWPWHTWAPTGHVAAPTAASMLLAGVIMKLGAYGALRMGLVLFPDGARMWQVPMALLSVVGIVFGAGVAFVQKDFKFVIGYSSVSHMGFVLLGLATLNQEGLQGAVLQMVSHGVIAGLLFGVVGRMVYDRAHTRELDALEAMGLARALPFAAGTMALGGAASMGLPGFSGFVAEFQVLVGSWRAFPVFALMAGVGIVMGVAYMLRVWNKTFFSDATVRGSGQEMAPMTWPEKLGAGLLLGVTVGLGLFPSGVMEWIGHALRTSLFEGLRRVGGW